MSFKNYFYGGPGYPKDSVIPVSITSRQLGEIYNFNHQMINKGYLKPKREGGHHIRKAPEMTQNNVEGKIAEFAVYDFLKEKHISCTRPTLWVGRKGKYDTGYDLYATMKHKKVTIEVKSSTLKAKSLMLEEKRWRLTPDNKIINHDHPNIEVPDIFVMVNVGSPQLISDNIFTDSVNGNNNENIICYYNDDRSINVLFNKHIKIPVTLITGVLLKNDLITDIKEKKSLFSNDIPTARTLQPLDAPNYIFPYYYGYVNPEVMSNYNKNYITRMRKPKSGFAYLWQNIN